MKIVKLESQNVKRLKAVSITPAGSTVVIGGMNGAGKTSVLDSIAYALAGGNALCEMPLRNGEKKGRVSVNLGDLMVTRTFTPDGGGSLTVSNADGTAKYASPQKILDGLVGRLAFDPLEFSRMDARRQATTLQSLVGLDMSQFDAKRAALFQQRTDANRDLRRLEAQLLGLPEHHGVPSETVDVSALAEELREIEAHNQQQRALEAKAANIRAMIREYAGLVDTITGTIKRLERELENERAKLISIEQKASAAQEELDGLPAPQMRDGDPVRRRIADADSVNAKVRANAARARTLSEVVAARGLVDSLTEQIERVDADKATALAGAKMPIAGLAFSDAEVTLNGIPFSQCSSAEQLRISVAIALAMNPKLRVLLIRDGSLLDDNNLNMIAEMAEAADAQVWIEVVGEDAAKCSVIIEDGEVKK